jgi:hypothetical protein
MAAALFAVEDFQLQSTTSPAKRKRLIPSRAQVDISGHRTTVPTRMCGDLDGFPGYLFRASGTPRRRPIQTQRKEEEAYTESRATCSSTDLYTIDATKPYEWA